MRNCREWEEPLALAAGGDLAPEERAAVDRHIANCPACAEVLAGLEQTVGSLHDAHAEPIAGAHFAAVRARVLAQIEPRPRRRWLWAAALATAVLLFALSWQKLAPVAPPPLVAAVPHCGGACVPGLPGISLPGQAKAYPTTPRPKHRPVVSLPPRPAVEPSSEPPSEPVTVKLLTDDPNVVIYWLGDPK